ncbi:MAG: PTS sugar transporter subunit IIA [Lachnospiraceae bacterium]|nr:PTS sugar transporter subunit IIA [Ruminococcus sp.]MCM1275304.1 PTS sugar transporter subunit IIA [Lachnospiraceae bacterium]
MNEKNLDRLINAASEKLGTPPDKLRKTLENGDVKGLSAGLSKSDKEKLREVLANKELMEKLRRASSPDDIMKILMNKR